MPNNTVSFYLLTDTHLVSPDIWEEGKPIDLRERGDQIALKATPQILDSFIDKILADRDTNVVVFTGDNVNGGDVASHNEFRDRLQKLKDAGKTVYVTCATHDYCSTGEDECVFHEAIRYTKTGTQPIPFLRKHELFDFYREFGPDQALSVHGESGSYTVKPGEGLRLIMICDNGNGRSHCGLFEDGVRWLTEQIREAKKAGDYVMLAVHHPVLPPWEVFRHMAEYELYGGYQELWKLMCEEGVRVVFTGHTHVQSIRKYTDEEGRWFLDVSTIALANAAGKMRKITVDTAAAVCSVESVGIDTLKGIDTGGLSAYDHLYHLNFPGIIEKLLPLGASDFDAFLSLGEGLLPIDKLRSHRFLVQKVCRKALRIPLSTAAKLGGTWRGFSREERRQLRKEPLITSVYEILRHIYTGNAPFSPETKVYRVFSGAAKKIDGLVRRFHIQKALDLIPPGSSLAEMAEDFLYNNRTGDDDTVTFSLK